MKILVWNTYEQSTKEWSESVEKLAQLTTVRKSYNTAVL